MTASRLIGNIQSSYRGRYGISLLQYSCMIVSTILVIPASSLLSSSVIAPAIQHQHFSSSIFESTCRKRHLTQQHGLEPFTKLCMSTSIPSTEINVTEATAWDTEEEDYEDEDVDEDDDDEALEENAALLEDCRMWTKAVDKAVKALGKKRKSLESELAKAEGAEKTAARAQLLVSNLYMFPQGVETATVNDWENDGIEVELTLDTKNYNSAQEEVDALFSLVRKLKRGSKIVAELLEETDDAWQILSEAKLDLESADGDSGIDEGRLEIVKERLIRTSRVTKFKVPTTDDGTESNQKRGGQNARKRKPELGSPASNVRKLMSPGGCIVLVGRNRRGNEHLSMTVARGNDIWMHSRGCPGAHVIIQNRRGSPQPTDECLQFGADLAIFYSDLRNENKAAVTAAEPKHIQKPRGAPLGAVKLREEWKTFVGFPDQVPDFLKEAREESGQTDEYHMFDKAKHRRRTKQVAEEDRAKKRQQQREKKSQR